MTTPGPFPREWREEFSADELERLAVRTVDGGMTDSEAVVAEGLNRRLWARKAKTATKERARRED